MNYGIESSRRGPGENPGMTSAKPSSARAGKARRLGAWLGLAVLAFAAWLAWPLLDRPGAPLADGTPLPGDAAALSLEQGWSARTQEQAWFASFGSRLLPYAWF